nr:hypothetical protein [uncultured Agathobaculum sp.]
MLRTLAKKMVLGSTAIMIAVSSSSCSMGYEEVYLVSSKMEYGSHGELEARSEYTYDDYGNKTSEDKYNSENNLIDTIRYEYDENKNLIREAGENSSTIEYIYDDTGNMIETRYNVGSDNEWLQTFVYDDSGNQIMRKDMDGRHVEFIYDADGKMIRRIDYTSDGEEDSRQEYGYDQAGNQISEQWYRDGSAKMLNLSSYNEKNQLVQVSYCTSNGTVIEYETYEYDENGNLINSTYFDRDNFIVSWVDYTYDVYKVKSG